VPLTVLIIFVILYTMFKSLKWAALIIVNVMMTPLGGMLALLLTHTHFSVSSGIGFLALFGVSVQTGVIMLEYINQRRARGHSIEEAAVEGAVLRLRPIMVTSMVATLGLLPAALSHAIGSDSQRPFAIVIVGGLISGLLLSIFLLANAVRLGGARGRRVAARVSRRSFLGRRFTNPAPWQGAADRQKTNRSPPGSSPESTKSAQYIARTAPPRH
jgi:Cu/Ag efflux pump CusA